jgi:hypothetical protein
MPKAGLEPTTSASKVEVRKLWGKTPEGRYWLSGWGVVCIRDIFILNDIWTQDKTYFGRKFNALKYSTYHLVPLLTQTISSAFCGRLKLEKYVTY